MANSTAFLGCSHSYSNVEENLKLFAQLVYLVPAFLLIGRMIYVINFVYKDDFHDQERFWNLYSTDLILNWFNLLLDIFYYRPSLFIPQFCESFSFFLRANPLLIDITFPLWYYFHVGKMVTQSFLCIERMSYNLLKTNDYRKLWKHLSTVSLFLVFFFPFTLIWNILLSDKYIQYYYGGFQPNYARRVNWFGTTAWQLSYMQISMGITVITNLISAFHHFKAYQEKNPSQLCIIWGVISIDYIFCGSIFCFLNKSFAFEYSNLIFILVFLVWDGFNIISPAIMIAMNKNLRKNVFAIEYEDEENQITHSSLQIKV
ncbi:CRE-SRG-6 protein [Caenorhabditis remanei]|uniref:Serpentine receptor class gamma n=1 Tax=Caenorhabditis remanei TaxID=31234 RepID=E3LWT2_CAERE|nr:CRE-SRG-6 protein [Caenorhabditis remanei]